MSTCGRGGTRCLQACFGAGGGRKVKGWQGKGWLMARVRYFISAWDPESGRWAKRGFPTEEALAHEVSKFSKWNEIAVMTGVPERCVDFKHLVLLERDT